MSARINRLVANVSKQAKIELAARNIGEIRKIQMRKLRRQMNFLKVHSPFYSRILSKKQANSFSDLNNLPYTTRSDLLGAPSSFLAVPLADVFRYFESTGTTGPQVFGFYTLRDWYYDVLVEFLGSFSSIITKDDVVMNCAPYQMSVPGHFFDLQCSLVGATIVAPGIPSNIAPLSKIVQLIRKLKATVLVCLPSKAFFLARVALEEKINAGDLTIDKIIGVGEWVTPQRINKLERTWGCDFYPAFGTTEIGIIASPCLYKKQHLWENANLVEVINPETNEPIGEGEEGELVVTSLQHKAMPLLRYRTGDIAVIHRDKCECGSIYPTIIHKGRNLDRLEIGTKNITHYQLEEAIFDYENTPGLYRAIYDRKSEKLIIELDGKAVKSREVSSEIKKRLKKYFGLNAIETRIVRDLAHWEKYSYESKPYRFQVI